MRNFKRRDKNAKEPSMKIYVRNNDINGAIRILKKKLMLILKIFRFFYKVF